MIAAHRRWAAEVSLLAAMLGLCKRLKMCWPTGCCVDIKTIRLIAYRYAARARLVQQVERTTFEDTVAHRRVSLVAMAAACGFGRRNVAPRPKKERGLERERGVNRRC